MDFELTEQQKAIQQIATQFAEREFTRERALEYDKNRQFPVEIHRKACELGLIGVHFAKEYGGQGLGVFEHLLVVEALCRKDPGFGAAMSLRAVGSEAILRGGSEEQKRKYLPKITAGELIPAIALTEPGHGSDVLDLETTATREGDEYVINGVKTFITNGMDAQLVGVVCKTDPEAKPPYRGMSIVLVETNRPGYKAVDLGEQMGQRMLRRGQLYFDNVRVPVSNLVGKENKGFYQAMEFFNEVRMVVAAQGLGTAEAAFDRAVNWVKERRQFGQRIGDFQATQHKIADMAMKIEAAKLIVYQAGWNYDNRGANALMASMAKSFAPQVATEVAYEALQLFGGYGWFEDHEIERIYRDSRILEIYEGTKEVQKNTIAAMILGKGK